MALRSVNAGLGSAGGLIARGGDKVADPWVPIAIRIAEMVNRPAKTVLQSLPARGDFFPCLPEGQLAQERMAQRV